jgi:glutamine transport system permease protein
MEYYFDFGVVWSNLGNLTVGLFYGLGLAIASLLIGIAIGLLLAFAYTSSSPALRRVAKTYVTVFRNIPLLIIIFIVYFGLPDLGIRFDKDLSFICSLSIYAGAYMTEVFRAGLLAIPKGIIEAGQTIGLSKRQLRFSIILPIMFSLVLPAMGNYLISLFKDTSLAASITIHELTYNARKINVETFRVFEAWLTAAAFYVAACYLIASLLRAIERKVLIR